MRCLFLQFQHITTKEVGRMRWFGFPFYAGVIYGLGTAYLSTTTVLQSDPERKKLKVLKDRMLPYNFV
jgi:predicted Kef-type K+ transport protein